MRRVAVLITLVLVVAVVTAAAAESLPQNNPDPAEIVWWSADPHNGVYRGFGSSSAAWAYVNRSTINTTGWGTLYVATSDQWSDVEQALWAGTLEGYLTWEDILMLNHDATFGFNSTSLAPLNNWFMKNFDWMQEMISENLDDPFWLQVNLVMQQVQGIYLGYTQAAKENDAPPLTYWDIFGLNAGGDIETLASVVYNLTGKKCDLENIGESGITPSARVAAACDWRNLTAGEFETYLGLTTHCSALMRLVPDSSEILAGHTTWGGWNLLIRYFKRYDFAFSSVNGSAISSVSFSSYPGNILSGDDYYITSQNLSVIETTNSIFNNSLYSLVTPASLLSFVRTVVANRMATNGPEWVEYFVRENSGTYNNQWMILDFKLFTPGQPLLADTLTIVESIPDYYESADVTSFLQDGFWPSYNVPFFPEIFDRSGYPSAVAQFGSFYTYHGAPRALLFAREAPLVVSIDTMKFVMQYNNYLNTSDPLSAGDPIRAIASRADLPGGSSQGLWGAFDSKFTTSNLIGSQTTITISGPTHQQGIAPFSFADYPAAPHTGMPVTYTFDWVVYTNWTLPSAML